MTIILKIILLLLGMLGFVVLLVWAYARYWFATKQSDREIARSLSIDSDWVEILPKPPLRIQKHVQCLLLLTDGDIQRSVTLPTQFELPDGTLIDPEVEVVDGIGNVMRLESFLQNSNLAYKTDFTKGEVLTRVRIRSQTPFRCSRVIWECERLK